VREIPLKDYPILFQSAIQTNTVPDVFCMFRYKIHEWGISMPAPEWVVNIFETEYMPEANRWQKYPESGSREEYKGKYLGWLSSEFDAGQMLYYNKDHFEEAGVDPENPPETSAELVEYAKKLTQYSPDENTILRSGWGIRHTGQKSGGITEKWAIPFLFWWHDPEKGYLFTDDWKDIQDWGSEDFVSALKFYQDMVWTWKVASLDLPVPEEAFKMGLASMVKRESFLEGIIKTDAPDLNYGIAPLVVGAPPYGTRVPGLWTSNQLSCVWKGTKYPDVAWDFNMFLNNDKHDLEISQISGGMPRRIANQESEYAKSLIWREAFDETLKRPPIRAEEYDPWGLNAQIQDILGDTVVACLLDPNAEPKEELEKARTRAQEVLRFTIEAVEKGSK